MTLYFLVAPGKLYKAAALKMVLLCIWFRERISSKPTLATN